MQFRDQVEAMLNCKVSGMCARDGLVTEALKNKGQDNLDKLLEAKQADDSLLIEMLKALNE